MAVQGLNSVRTQENPQISSNTASSRPDGFLGQIVPFIAKKSTALCSAACQSMRAVSPRTLKYHVMKQVTPHQFNQKMLQKAEKLAQNIRQEALSDLSFVNKGPLKIFEDQELSLTKEAVEEKVEEAIENLKSKYPLQGKTESAVRQTLAFHLNPSTPKPEASSSKPEASSSKPENSSNPEIAGTSSVQQKAQASTAPKYNEHFTIFQYPSLNFGKRVIGYFDNRQGKHDYPHAHAVQLLNRFVRSEKDGCIRRYPGNDQWSANYESQIKPGFIYDGKKNQIKKNISGYQFDPNSKQGFYQINGQPASAMFKYDLWEVYQLADGRHMIPQPLFKSCTYACEYMLLMDQNYVTPEYVSGKIPLNYNNRRNEPDIVASLKRAAGVDPIEKTVHTHEALQASLAEHGPAILSVGGHVVMLDAVKKVKLNLFQSSWVFEVREPFHGSCSQIDQSADMFKDRKDFKLIFLPKKISNQNMSNQ